MTPVNGRMTVGQWLDRWLAEYVVPTAAEATVRTYRTQVERHIKPALGGIVLARLNEDHVQSMLNRLDPRLSGSTRNFIMVVLRAALNRAVRSKHVRENVALGVNAPSRTTKAIDPWTPDEAQAFLATLAGDRCEGPITVAMLMGLRQGEVVGLRWSDIDFATGTLTVNGQLDRYQRVHVATKTAESERTLHMPARVVAILRDERTRRMRGVEARLAGGEWADTGFVFTDPAGAPLAHDRLRRVFKRLATRSGLRPQRFHDLRHQAASFQLATGASMAEVAAFLGHGDRSRMTQRYAHLYPAARMAAAARTDSLFPAAADGSR
jgi:integrase